MILVRVCLAEIHYDSCVPVEVGDVREQKEIPDVREGWCALLESLASFGDESHEVIVDIERVRGSM